MRSSKLFRYYKYPSINSILKRSDLFNIVIGYSPLADRTTPANKMESQLFCWPLDWPIAEISDT